MDLLKKSLMCTIVTLFGFHGYFMHKLSQLFLARLLINVYETIVIHSAQINFASAKVRIFFGIYKLFAQNLAYV